MRLIVGLGNPGRRYEGTRHNLGFAVLDGFARRYRSSFREGTGDYLVAQTDVGDVPVILLKPTTYMNGSGTAIQDAVRAFEIPYADTLIVFDDFHLPLGTIRLRPGGTDGGHNGMASVIYHAETDAIPRMRCGIGREDPDTGNGDKTSFVLAPFDANELGTVEAMIDRASQGIEVYVRDGLNAAMNILNKKPEPNG